MVNSYEERLYICFKNVKEKIDFTPKIAIILGSGLGALADEIEIFKTLEYSEIEGFPTSTVSGHRGRFVFGYIEKVPVVIMQGRVHYYEGYDMQLAVLPVRLMRLLGAEILFLTNASGSVNLEYKAGDFMLIKDHISNFIPNPLIGKNYDKLGPRFPDMSGIYDCEFRDVIKNNAENLGIPLREGVYIQLTGPSYESPAEIRMCRTLGADVVGMSTACEAIAARHAGMKICGISCVSNLGCGISETPLNHNEVMEAAEKSAPLFKKLIKTSVINIAKADISK